MTTTGNATIIGTFSKKIYAEREALSLSQDAPEGVEIVLSVDDNGVWSVVEYDNA